MFKQKFQIYRDLDQAACIFLFYVAKHQFLIIRKVRWTSPETFSQDYLNEIMDDVIPPHLKQAYI